MAPSRGHTILTSVVAHVCTHSRQNIPATVSFPFYRTFTSGPIFHSGHNRWSKIKHDKAKTDSVKNSQRSQFAKELTLASKLFGPDPAMNPRLADLITTAKRQGFAKASIEAAIARGQGRNVSGAALENVLVEGILPSNIAIMVECETDQKLRTLQDVRLILKNAGGTASPASYLFNRVGRVTFDGKHGTGMSEVMDEAIEAGAVNIWAEVEPNDTSLQRVCLSTEPADTFAVGDQIAQKLELTIAASDIIWEPKEETVVALNGDKHALELTALVDELLDKEASVQSIALNAAQGTADHSTWFELQKRLLGSMYTGPCEGADARIHD